jgi:heme oxygenase
MVGEWSAAFLAETGQYIKHARWKEFLADLGEQQDTERCILCCFEDECVAGAERGADLEGCEKVPARSMG